MKASVLSWSPLTVIVKILQNIYFVCKEEQKSFRFGLTWGWINDDIFEWTTPLSNVSVYTLVFVSHCFIDKTPCLVQLLLHFHIIHAPDCVVFTQGGELFSLLLKTPEMCHTTHRHHKLLNLASSLQSRLWVTHRYEVNLWECVFCLEVQHCMWEQQRGRRSSALWVVSAYGRRRSSHSPRQTGLCWVARRPAWRLY